MLASPLRSWTFNRRGLPLRVWALGEGTGEVVLCLHGWLDQGLSWAATARGRSGRWLAVDHRGHGGSGHVGPGETYHFAEYLADIDALVDTLGTPLSLVGHSMGGTLAAIYAGLRPDRVRSLVLVDGIGLPEPQAGQWLTRMGEFLEGAARIPPRIRLDSVEQAAERLLRRHPRLHPAHARLLAEHGTTRDGDRLYWSFDPKHLLRAPVVFPEAAIADFMRAIEAPTLMVWPSRSIYPQDLQDLRASYVRRLSVASIESGHQVPYEAASELGDLIEGHLLGASR